MRPREVIGREEHADRFPCVDAQVGLDDRVQEFGGSENEGLCDAAEVRVVVDPGAVVSELEE